TPHVAGAAAIIFGLHPSYTADEVKQTITNETTVDVIIDPSGTPNRLLYIEPMQIKN
ncbi:S8 family serine peptidase, partial [Salmonella sp. s55044]